MCTDMIMLGLLTNTILIVFALITVGIVLQEEIKNISKKIKIDKCKQLLDDNKHNIIIRDKNCNIIEYSTHYGSCNQQFCLDNDLFPEVTFENSPQQVEIKLIKE